VDAYLQAFSAVVSEEKQTQTLVRPDRRAHKVREISVPVELTERYWQAAKPGEDVLEVRATYSSFRRFEVTTGEQIKK
jgi:hypothetical protein